MKVVEVVPSLITGGGEKFVIDLSNSLARAGHDCTLLSMYDPSEDDRLRVYVEDGVHTASLGKRPGADLRCMLRLARYIRTQKPDVVHVHLAAIMYVFVAALFCRRVKFFATIHSEARREAGTGISKWVRKILFGCGLVTPVTISEESEKSFERFYGFDAVMIPNGSSDYILNDKALQEFEGYRNGVDLLFFHAGRIHGVKNQVMLVDAFEQVLQRGVNARLLIAGRVEDRSIFAAMAPHFSDKIVYVGEQTDIRALMSVADAFCLSSTMEGMPITIIEAFSVGCVPVVTPVGGCLNMVESGTNGFISKDLTSESYAQALCDFATLTKEQRAVLKERCLSDFRAHYSIDMTTKRYLNIWQK